MVGRAPSIGSLTDDQEVILAAEKAHQCTRNVATARDQAERDALDAQSDLRSLPGPDLGTLILSRTGLNCLQSARGRATGLTSFGETWQKPAPS
ncbi:hypothetical protein M877_03285 [Streptomyces niveus NCIMB 11891]|nr:hypothetical protein M877_03285 [Streptomyces niveus NCIMB 11891]